jgi:hypothetical protein
MYLVGVGFEIPDIGSLVPRQEHLAFTVAGGGNHGSVYPEAWPGVVCPILEWRTDAI